MLSVHILFSESMQQVSGDGIFLKKMNNLYLDELFVLAKTDHLMLYILVVLAD